MRTLIYTRLLPMGNELLAELKEKLDAPKLTLDFSSLESCDLRARAQAFSAMTAGGMSEESAMKICAMDYSKEQ